MITFDEFATRLAFGQLKGTAAVEDSIPGQLLPDYSDIILSLTNQGLVDLTTKFPLITQAIDLTFQTGVNTYPLTDAGLGTYLDFSVTGDTFVGENFVKVLYIYDEDGVNHPHNTNGHIITPTYNVLRFTSAKILELGDQVRINYQSKHLPITASDNINLPPNLETALQLFVSSLYFSHMNGAEHTIKGEKYFGAYLRHIGEDVERNTSSISETNEDTRFVDRGFV